MKVELNKLKIGYSMQNDYVCIDLDQLQVLVKLFHIQTNQLDLHTIIIILLFNIFTMNALNQSTENTLNPDIPSERRYFRIQDQQVPQPPPNLYPQMVLYNNQQPTIYQQPGKYSQQPYSNQQPPLYQNIPPHFQQASIEQVNMQRQYMIAQVQKKYRSMIKTLCLTSLIWDLVCLIFLLILRGGTQSIFITFIFLLAIQIAICVFLLAKNNESSMKKQYGVTKKVCIGLLISCIATLFILGFILSSNDRVWIAFIIYLGGLYLLPKSIVLCVANCQQRDTNRLALLIPQQQQVL